MPNFANYTGRYCKYTGQAGDKEATEKEYASIPAEGNLSYFYPPENQEFVREVLGDQFPKVVEVTEEFRFEKMKFGHNIVPRSRPVGTEPVPHREFVKLVAALKKLQDIGNEKDGNAFSNPKKLAQAFRLPDPVKCRDQYRLYGPFWNRKLLVIWGITPWDQTADTVKTLPPNSLPVETPVGGWLKRLLPLLLLLALGWAIWNWWPSLHQNMTVRAEPQEAVIGSDSGKNDVPLKLVLKEGLHVFVKSRSAGSVTIPGVGQPVDLAPDVEASFDDFQKPGNYEVIWTPSDRFKKPEKRSILVQDVVSPDGEVSQVAPTATLVLQPNGRQKGPVDVKAFITVSHAGKGRSIAKYEMRWDKDDAWQKVGDPNSDSLLSHHFNAVPAGSAEQRHEVGLKVTDDLGIEAENSEIVSIVPEDQPHPPRSRDPIALLSIDQVGADGSLVISDGGSYALDGTLKQWTIDWGDESPAKPSETKPTAVSHQYKHPKNLLKYTVTDNLGGTSTIKLEVPPVVTPVTPAVTPPPPVTPISPGTPILPPGTPVPPGTPPHATPTPPGTPKPPITPVPPATPIPPPGTPVPPGTPKPPITPVPPATPIPPPGTPVPPGTPPHATPTPPGTPKPPITPVPPATPIPPPVTPVPPGTPPPATPIPPGTPKPPITPVPPATPNPPPGTPVPPATPPPTTPIPPGTPVTETKIVVTQLADKETVEIALIGPSNAKLTNIKWTVSQDGKPITTNASPNNARAVTAKLPESGDYEIKVTYDSGPKKRQTQNTSVTVKKDVSITIQQK